MTGGNFGRIKYIIKRRARVRLVWPKMHEEIGNITQVCREWGISCKTFCKWWPLYAKKDSLGLRIAPNA